MGTYADASNTLHGFMLSGSYTTLSLPYPVPTQGAFGINNYGQIVAYNYWLYVGRPGGSYTSITAPGAYSFLSPLSSPLSSYGINDSGQIVGTYDDVGGTPHGFLFTVSKYGLPDGSYTSLDAPGSTYTVASGINDSGQIVGYYGPAYQPYDWPRLGYLLTNGIYSPVDVPGADSTLPFGINDSGQIVGAYGNAGNPFIHGFLLTGGSYTTLDVPGAIRTFAYGINDSGQVVGYYEDDSGGHGFLATPLPEPASISLLGIGLACFVCYSWRQQRRGPGVDTLPAPG